MDTKKLVKERIKYLCKEKGVNINEISNEAGVSPTTYYSIIGTKSKNPGIVTIKYLCDALEISLYDFFNTEEFRSKEQEMK